VVLTDPYLLPFETSSVDIVLSSSCFEHSEMFWLSFLEALRIMKPSGLFYLNVPSNAQFHRYPVDCWRFYPDCGMALVTWAKRNGIPAALLESFTTPQVTDVWNDFVAVFLKDDSLIGRYPSRILDAKENYTNGLVHGGSELSNFSVMPEDKRKLDVISKIISNEIKVGGPILKSKRKLEAISKIISNEMKV
jgi:SAM-dependent methyltransferase